MILRRIWRALEARWSGLLQARRIKASLFSGTPILTAIAPSDTDPGAWSLTYRNGLMLTLGDAGILDYQDTDFGHYVGGSEPDAQRFRTAFLAQLHRIVLKSLLRHITHPGLEAGQRERAAEAASKLYMAAENPPAEGNLDMTVADDGSWSAGSPRERAPLR
jgi:hypothetical protein